MISPPPPLEADDPRQPRNDRRYADVPAEELPSGESLKDVVARFLPYWESTIVPEIRARQRVLIAAHGNSLRALVKHLDNVSDEDILELNIPTGMPLVYELDDDLQPLGSRYLGSPEEVEKAMAQIAAQGRAPA